MFLHSKSLQQQLEEERDLLEAIISSMGEGLLVVGRDYKISKMNPAAEEILGISEEEAIGKPWMEVVVAYKGDSKIPFDERTSIVVLNTGRTMITKVEDNHYYKLASGRFFPVSSVTAPIKSNNEIVGAVKVFKDASIEKGAKEELTKKVKELESLNKLMVGRELKMMEMKRELRKHAYKTDSNR